MISNKDLQTLVRLRLESGYSMAQLVDATGIDGATISWELKQFGKAHNVDLNSPLQCKRISKADEARILAIVYEL